MPGSLAEAMAFAAVSPQDQKTGVSWSVSPPGASPKSGFSKSLIPMPLG